MEVKSFIYWGPTVQESPWVSCESSRAPGSRALLGSRFPSWQRSGDLSIPAWRQNQHGYRYPLGFWSRVSSWRASKQHGAFYLSACVIVSLRYVKSHSGFWNKSSLWNSAESHQNEICLSWDDWARCFERDSYRIQVELAYVGHDQILFSSGEAN